MSVLKFLQQFFEMSAGDFLREWKALDKKDQEELRELGTKEARRQGIEVKAAA